MLDSSSLKDFFFIIRLGLSNEKYSGQDTSLFNWKTMYQMAQHQSLIGVFVDGITCLPNDKRPSIDYFLNWVAMTAKIERSNLMLNNVLNEFVSHCNDHGFSSLLLKGQGIAQSYPNPLRRQSGDIDLYFGKAQFENVNQLIFKLGGKETHQENIKHSSWNYKGVEIENHRIITSFENKHHQKHFLALLSETLEKPLECEIGDSKVCKPNLRFDCVYILKHCVDHFLDQGLGFRQPIDWLQLVTTNINDIDSEQFRFDIERTGLYDAAVAFSWIGVTYLGYNNDDIPIEIPNQSRLGRIVLDDILHSGNFGHIDIRFKSKPRNLILSKWYGFIRATERSNRLKAIFPNEAKGVSKNKIKKFINSYLLSSLKRKV